MYLIQRMVQDIEEKYHKFLEGKGGILYVFRKLWKEYDISACTDEEGMLERLIFNIIIASMVVKEETDIIEYYGMRICKILWEYRENKENLHAYYSDNDMELLEGMIDQIASKNKMYPVKQMITDIADMYLMFLKSNLGIYYVFANLWDIYRTDGSPDEESMIESLIFDIIIASMNIKEEASTVADFGMEIRHMMREYEENKEKLPIYYDDSDMKLIEDMINQINACKEKWVK